MVARFGKSFMSKNEDCFSLCCFVLEEEIIVIPHALHILQFSPLILPRPIECNDEGHVCAEF